MAIGDVVEVTQGACRDLFVLDSGLYGEAGYGGIYIYDTDRPAVVETSTGGNHDLLLDALDTLGIARTDLESIILTHVHLDHAGGAGQLAADCPNAKVFIHETGAPFLSEPARLVSSVKRVVGELWAYHVDPEPIPPGRITQLTDGDVIDLGDRTLETIHVPGHATHQVAFHDVRSEALFTADAAGMWLPGSNILTVTTPPTSFDLEQSRRDLDRLSAIDPDTLLYTHFGPRAAGTALADYDDLLTEWVTAIEVKREEMDDEALVEYFATTSSLTEALEHPTGNLVARMSVQGVLKYLDRTG